MLWVLKEHMLWELKSIVSMRRFFWAQKTYVKTDGKEIISNFTLSFYGLSWEQCSIMRHHILVKVEFMFHRSESISIVYI